MVIIGKDCWNIINDFKRQMELVDIKDGYMKNNDNCWKKVCRNEKLSEEFIRQFQDKVFWESISMYQELSEDFIREFSTQVQFVGILFHIGSKIK